MFFSFLESTPDSRWRYDFFETNKGNVFSIKYRNNLNTIDLVSSYTIMHVLSIKCSICSLHCYSFRSFIIIELDIHFAFVYQIILNRSFIMHFITLLML